MQGSIAARVAVFPESWRSNPVMDLMERAITARGVQFVPVGSDWLSFGWLWRQRAQVSVLHFHWLEYHYRRSSVAASWAALAKFCAKLIFARLLGYRIVWTMHNLMPHEREDPLLDTLAWWFLARIATATVVHCEEARRLLWSRYHRHDRVFMAYLGHYIDAYPQRVSRMDARTRLGLSQDSVVLLSFGGVRPYKGLERLLEEFGAISDPRLCLVIAGQPLDDIYGEHIRKLSGLDVRVRPVLEWIPDDEVPLYFEACDVVVLPFSSILTSSSVLTAMSFARAVIAPAIGCLPEIVDSSSGLLYDPSEPGALRSALQRCVELDLEAMGRGALEQVRRFTWDDLAIQTNAAYGV